MTEAVAGAVFAGWFVLTVCAQFGGTRAARFVRRFDVLGLAPTWTLFAPAPIRSDYDLLVGWSADLAGPFRYARVHCDRRPVLGAAWNPGRRHWKAVVECTRALALGDPRSADLAGTALERLAREHAPPHAVAVRFLVVRTAPGSPPEVVLRSPARRVPS